MEELENQLIGVRRDLSTVVETFNKDKRTLMEELDSEFQKHKLMLGEVVEGARREFTELRTGLNELYQRTDGAVTAIQQRVTLLEENSSSGSGNSKGGARGYLPQKSMIPKTFSDKHEEWRVWQDEVSM